MSELYLYRPCKYSRTLKEFTPNLCPFPFGSSFGDFRGRRVCLHFSIIEAAGPRLVIWSKVLELKENWSFQSWRRLSDERWNIFRMLKEVHLPSTWITETLHRNTSDLLTTRIHSYLYWFYFLISILRSVLQAKVCLCVWCAFILWMKETGARAEVGMETTVTCDWCL